MYKDTRLGEVGKWYHSKPKDADMKIPKNVLKTVCFICVKTGDSYQPFGTGFFVGLEYEEGNFTYFVTARHLVDDAKDLGYKTFYLRLNKHNGGIDYVQLNNEVWLEYEDSPIDLLAFPIVIPIEVFDYELLPTDLIATDEIIEKYNIGLGDELLVVGLFTKRKGRTKNIPIMRVGSIAAMPDEPLVDEYGYEYDSYLGEIRSIGGLSGSPVFVYLNRFISYQSNLATDQHWKIFLIGLIRGHWEIKENVRDSDFINDSLPRLSEVEKLNTGIALITPSQYVYSLLFKPELEEFRRKLLLAREKENQPVLDIGLEETK